MDSLDREIVKALSEDARRSYTQIAKDLGVATSTIHGRVNRLIQQGLIRGFSIDLDWEALGLPLSAVVFLRSHAPRALPDVAAAISGNPYVVSCSAITGEFDLFAVVRARNPGHLGEIIDDLRRRGDANTETMLILDALIPTTNPPLDHGGERSGNAAQDGSRSSK